MPPHTFPHASPFPTSLPAPGSLISEVGALTGVPSERPLVDRSEIAALTARLWSGPLPLNEIHDLRIRRLAADVAAAPDNWEKIRESMDRTQLSAAYLSVRFKQGTRLPMRSYALWMKFEHACCLALSGLRPADAASRAGFTDQSHLGRAARRFAKMSFGKALLTLRGELNAQSQQLAS